MGTIIGTGQQMNCHLWMGGTDISSVSRGMSTTLYSLESHWDSCGFDFVIGDGVCIPTD